MISRPMTTKNNYLISNVSRPYTANMNLVNNKNK